MGGNIRQLHPVVDASRSAQHPIFACLVSEHVYFSVAVVKTNPIPERMNARRKIHEVSAPPHIHVQHAVVNARLVFIRQQPGPRGIAHFGLLEIDGMEWITGASRSASNIIVWSLAKARAGHE